MLRMRATIGTEGHVTYAVLDESGAPTGAALHDARPTEILLAALAGCFLKSAAAVRRARREPPESLGCEVVGEEAQGRPSRFAWVEIRPAFDALPVDTAARIARDAKRVCTVSNSLGCEVRLAGQPDPDQAQT